VRVCAFFFIFYSLLSCGSSSFSSRFEKGRARGESGGATAARGSLSLFFFLSLSIARAGARGHTRTHTPLFHRQNDVKLGGKKSERERKREKKNREMKAKKKERKKITEERRRKKRALETRARVLIERKKARRSCRFPQKTSNLRTK